MPEKQPSRRRFVKATAAATVFGLAGCSEATDDAPDTTTTTTSGSTTANDTATTAQPTKAALSMPIEGPKHGDDLPTDQKPLDGYPPAFDTTPKEQSIDTGEFETLQIEDVEVPLVPVDVAYYWYARGEARFVDARSASEYEVSHVFGSVLSPAMDDREPDPVYEWPKDDRIVTYCDCPHHLAALRAGDLLNRGWENVYAVDEGFRAWRKREYPLAGSDTDRKPELWYVSGRTDDGDAGETAWAYHVGSDQKEASTIAADGTYRLRIPFVDVDAESMVRIETPSYSVFATLGDLSSRYVTEEGEVSSRPPATSTTTND